MKPPVKPAPPKKDLSQFSKHAIAEDTEREMTGRPQRFGAAVEDEPDVEQAQPGQEHAPAEAQGVEPEQPGLEEGMPDPSQANSREEAEAQANDHIGRTQDAGKMVASHHGHLHDLHKRLKALEDKSGGQGHDAPTGSGPQAASYDDEGY